MKKIIKFTGGFISNMLLVEKLIAILMITSFILGGNDNMSSVILAIVGFSIVESVIDRMYNNKKNQ